MDIRPHFERSNERLRLTGETELYDLSADPACENDLLIEELEVSRRLRERLIEWLESAEDLALSESQQRTSNDEAMLEGLGYASSNTAVSSSWWDPERWARGGWKNSPGTSCSATRATTPTRSGMRSWPGKIGFADGPSTEDVRRPSRGHRPDVDRLTARRMWRTPSAGLATSARLTRGGCGLLRRSHCVRDPGSDGPPVRPGPRPFEEAWATLAGHEPWGSVMIS